MQLLQRDGLCEIAARITPEHRVSTKPYSVVATINELEEEILNVHCQDCTAAQGPCKHAAAFVGWLERRSAEKAVTSVTSYWKKARLFNVTVETKMTRLESLKKKMRKKSTSEQNIGDEFFRDILALPSQNGLIYDHFGNNHCHLEHLGIDHLLQMFYKEHTGGFRSDEFLQFCRVKIYDTRYLQLDRKSNNFPVKVISLACFEVCKSNCIKGIQCFYCFC